MMAMKSICPNDLIGELGMLWICLQKSFVI